MLGSSKLLEDLDIDFQIEILNEERASSVS